MKLNSVWHNCVSAYTTYSTCSLCMKLGQKIRKLTLPPPAALRVYAEEITQRYKKTKHGFWALQSLLNQETMWTKVRRPPPQTPFGINFFNFFSKPLISLISIYAQKQVFWVIILSLQSAVLHEQRDSYSSSALNEIILTY